MKRRFFYLASISPDLVGRLENWADVVRVTPRLNVSATGRFCESLARSKGQIEQARFARPDLNETDAFDVEKAMHWVPRRPRTLLIAHYVHRVYPWRLHSSMRPALWAILGFAIRKSDWESEITKAHWSAESALARIEIRAYNARHNSAGLVPIDHTTGFVRPQTEPPRMAALSYRRAA